MASELIDEGLLRTLLMRSAQLPRVAFLSVRRIGPSVLRRSDAPEDRGP